MDQLLQTIEQLEDELRASRIWLASRLDTIEYLRSYINALEDELNALYGLFYDLGIEHPLSLSVGELYDYRDRIQKGSQ